MRTRLRAVARWWPAAYCAVLGSPLPAAWFEPHWPLDARILLTELSVIAAAWFLRWRLADRKARRLQARGDRSLACERCGHYACEGEQCISCDGACAAPHGVMSINRPRVPRPRADWLN